MKLNNLFRLLFLLLITPDLFAQTAAPANYFTFPIKPGQQNYLSGTMGEIRSNHFHGGIDIKTDQRIGLPVYAAADGYVSRIKMSSYGYGNLIFLTHPNGKVTTYGHLNEFTDTLADYVLQHQYRQETFDIDLFPEKNQFFFKKGSKIAYSGNTGGSGGPHLHFEIRDTSNVLYNPLQYGFSEIKDSTPPTVSAFALKTFSIDARINNEFGLSVFPVRTNGNVYNHPDTIYAHGVIGLQVQAIDQLDEVYNRNGNQQMVMQVNNKPHFSYLLDKIPYAKSRQVSWHINYEYNKETRKNFQKCYVDDGNTLPIYEFANNLKGKLHILPDQVYHVKVAVLDSYQNTTTVQFVIAGRKPTYTNTNPARVSKLKMDYEVHENILKITATDTAEIPRNIKLYKAFTRFDLVPSYTEKSASVYLYDLRAGLPDSMEFCGITEIFNFKHTIPSDTDYSFFNKHMEVIFGRHSLFDTLYLQTNYADQVFRIQDKTIPLYHNIKVTLKPDFEVADKSKSAVYNISGRWKSFAGGSWQGNEITFSTRSFGEFAILTDSTAPSISLLSKSSKQLRFRIRDDLSGINSFHCQVNGKWLLLRYEHKSALLFSEKLDKTLPLSGEVILKVTDNAGNEAIYKTRI